MTTGTICRDCSQPIEWRDTDQGRRPFDLDGRSHFASCPNRSPRRNGTATTKDRTIARLAVLKAAADFMGQLGQAREQIKADHVLTVAEKWLEWVERED